MVVKSPKKAGLVLYLISVHTLALIGLVFVGVFFAIRLKLTNVAGGVDTLSSAFEEEALQNQVLGVSNSIGSDATQSAESIQSIEANLRNLQQKKTAKVEILCSLKELTYVSPKNVKKIIELYQNLGSELVAKQMIFALENYLPDKDNYEGAVRNCVTTFDTNPFDLQSIAVIANSSDSANLLVWPDKKEWADAATSIAKDKALIDKAAGVAGIEPRLIVSSLMVEQLRLFYSQRELYKKYFEPLKILANSNKISLGVMAIKEETAQAIESHLKDGSSPYYLGAAYEHLLDYPSEVNQGKERYKRLSDFNHYYNYLYGALYLKQFLGQWQKAGYDIRWRPEILGTLFNVGFPQSKPNANPQVGGSSVKIDQTTYSFGRLAYEFYYSGELINEFPITEP